MRRLSRAKKLLFMVAALKHSIFFCCDRSAEMSETASVFMCECHPLLDTPLTWDNRLRKATIVMCVAVQFVKKNEHVLAQGQPQLVTAGLKINLVLSKFKSYCFFLSISLDWATWGFYCNSKKKKKGHLKVRDGVMLSMCVSETVPLGLCHSASDCLTSMRVYVGWIVHATLTPPGQIGVLCAYICIIIRWRCLCFLYLCLPFFSFALFVNNDAMLHSGITVGFILYFD